MKLKYIYILIIATVFFLLGFYFSNIKNTLNQNNFFKLASASDSNISIKIPSILDEINERISEKFIFWKSTSTLPTQTDLEYGMIKGYVNAYNDPYTNFFTPEEAKVFAESMQGSFGGIGAQIGIRNNLITIIAPLKNSPAERAGLKAGDVVISVNDISIAGMNLDKVISMVRGEPGTIVKLEIISTDDISSKKVEIKREIIKVPDIDTEILDNVFVIHFYTFNANSESNFKKALNEFRKSNKNKLLISLRGNGGGFLDSAIDITSLFLPSEKIIVIEKGSRTKEDKIYYSKGFDYLKNLKKKNIKIAVLIDGGSASASEIFAGALKDHKVATIIGEKSFGKGSVQELSFLSDGSALKLTISKWYTPNLVNISESGIIPDIIATSTLATTTAKTSTSTKIIDKQLKEALNFLNKIK